MVEAGVLIVIRRRGDLGGDRAALACVGERLLVRSFARLYERLLLVVKVVETTPVLGAAVVAL